MGAYISSIGIANPANKYTQETIADFMCNNFATSDEEKKKIKILYRATGIRERYSVLNDYKKVNGSYSFYSNTPDLEPFPTTEQRMKLYREKAVPLAIEAISNCTHGREDYSSFTHLITVSCTGMYAPGLDVDIIKALNLRPDINRTSLNFMGCYAAMNALVLAKEYCSNRKNIKVLVVSVELCSIHLQKKQSEDNLLAHSLFSDGAAAAIVTSDPQPENLEICSASSYLALNGKHDMAWQIGDFGFEMSLTSYVPNIIKNGIGELTKNLLKDSNLSLKDIDTFAVHPGGKKILEAVEKELKISKTDNALAYDVLRKYGNMSSPTILFVLKNLMTNQKPNQNVLSFAFGPGLTMETILFKTH
ncbi:MAG: type III polyketide synthase [Reichenbachiella sp.]